MKEYSSQEELYHDLLKFTQEGDLEQIQDCVVRHEEKIVWGECLQPKSQDSCLHLAAREGHAYLLRYLLSTGARVCLELGNRDGKRPVHEAAHFSQLDCMQLLIEAGCDVNALKRADWTPLMLACTRSDARVVTSLLSAGALTTLVNKDGWTAAHIAARAGHADALRILLREQPRLMAVHSKTGRSLLHTAAFHGHLGIVRYLVADLHTAIDVRDSSQSTPLMDACRAGHGPVAEYLLSGGADLETTDRLGRPALHAAAQTGAVEVVSLLIERLEMRERNAGGTGGSGRCEEREEGGATVHAIDWDGGELCGTRAETDSVIDRSTHRDDTAAEQAPQSVPRVRAASGVDFRADDGSTALHAAAREGHGQVCALLVAHGADRTARDSHGRTPADLALIHKHVALADLLRPH